MEMLSYGVLTTISDNTIRGLPPHGGHLFISPTSAVSVDFSNSPTMANPINMLPASGSMYGTYGYSSDIGARVSSGYIRVNGGTAIVKISKQ